MIFMFEDVMKHTVTFIAKCNLAVWYLNAASTCENAIESLWELS